MKEFPSSRIMITPFTKLPKAILGNCEEVTGKIACCTWKHVCFKQNVWILPKKTPNHPHKMAPTSSKRSYNLYKWGYNPSYPFILGHLEGLHKPNLDITGAGAHLTPSNSPQAVPRWPVIISSTSWNSSRLATAPSETCLPRLFTDLGWGGAGEGQGDAEGHHWWPWSSECLFLWGWKMRFASIFLGN